MYVKNEMCGLLLEEGGTGDGCLMLKHVCNKKVKSVQAVCNRTYQIIWEMRGMRSHRTYTSVEITHHVDINMILNEVQWSWSCLINVHCFLFKGINSRTTGDTRVLSKRGPGSILTWALSSKRPLIHSDRRQLIFMYDCPV
jgi:hypothetical protein